MPHLWHDCHDTYGKEVKLFSRYGLDFILILKIDKNIFLPKNLSYFFLSISRILKNNAITRIVINIVAMPKPLLLK